MIFEIDSRFNDIDNRYMSWIPQKVYEILRKNGESEMFFQQMGGPYLEGIKLRFKATYFEDEDKLKLERLL
jgi:hypothetical protein